MASVVRQGAASLLRTLSKPAAAAQSLWPLPTTARRVFVRVTLLSLDTIETATQTWSGTLVFEFIFTADKRVVAAAVGKDAEGKRVEGDALRAVLRGSFWPVFSNVHKTTLEERWASKGPNDIFETNADKPAFLLPAGHAPITLSVKYKASFIQRFDFLHHYPFDSELLKIRLSMEQTAEQLVYATFPESKELQRRLFQLKQQKELETLAAQQAAQQPQPHTPHADATPATPNSPHVVAIDGSMSAALTEWRLRDAIGSRASLSSGSASRSGNQYSHLTVMIPVKRHSSFVVWNFIIPFSLVTFCMVLAFFLSVNDRGERLGIGSGLLLAAVAFKGSVSSLIPRVGRLTLLEMFIFIGILLIVVSVSVAVTLADWPEIMLAGVGALAQSDVMTRVPVVWWFAPKAAVALQHRAAALAAAAEADPALLAAGAAPAHSHVQDALEPVDNFLGVLLTLLWLAYHAYFVWSFYDCWSADAKALQGAQGARTPDEQQNSAVDKRSCGWEAIDQDVDLEHYYEWPCDFRAISDQRHESKSTAKKTTFGRQTSLGLGSGFYAAMPVQDEPSSSVGQGAPAAAVSGAAARITAAPLMAAVSSDADPKPPVPATRRRERSVTRSVRS